MTFERVKRTPVLCLMLLAIAALAVAQFRGGDFLLYNNSPSIAAGFYVRTGAPPLAGSLVTVRAESVAPREASARGFTDEGDRFIKRIAAVPGDQICANGGQITINGQEAAQRRPGVIVRWEGCRVLSHDEVCFLAIRRTALTDDTGDRSTFH